MTSGSAMREPVAAAEVTVRYWAAARAATGADSETLQCPAGATVADVLDGATGSHPELGTVLRVASVLLDGRSVDRSTVVSHGAVLEVLPPFAGG